MPCRSDEEEMQLYPNSGGTDPSTPLENDGARHAESDGDGVSTEDDDDAELQLPVKKKRNITTATYQDVKRWVSSARDHSMELHIFLVTTTGHWRDSVCAKKGTDRPCQAVQSQ